jgi:hypothetical protein
MNHRTKTEPSPSGVPPALGRRYQAVHAGTVPLTPTQRATRDAILQHDRPEDWEEGRCLCGDTAGLLLSEIDRHGLPYRKRLCGTCGLLRVSPRWNANRYARFYEKEYRDLYQPVESSKDVFIETASASANVRDLAKWVTDSTKRFEMPSSPTIVEIGTGGAWNLINLPASWTRIGFDVDDDYLAIARSTAAIDLRHGFLDQAISSGCVRAANIVLLSHVVEHFIDPIEQLQRLRQAMSRDCLLLIEVPGVFSIHWSRQDPMRMMQNAHIHTFCAETLAAVCRRAGYRVSEVDETVRAVCRPDTAERIETANCSFHRPELSRKVFRYLRSCERGASVSRKLRQIPIVGRLGAALFRRLWFASVGILHR